MARNPHLIGIIRFILCLTLITTLSWNVFAANDPINLKLYFPLGKKSLQWETLTKFMDEVEKASQGKVLFKRYCCKSIGSGLDAIESVKGGALDMTAVGVGMFIKYSPRINMIMLPYLFRDYDHVYKFVKSPLWEDLTKDLSQHGFKPLSNINAGFRDLLTTSKPVSKVADLQGMKVKIGQNSVFITVWKNFGALAIPMKSNLQYTALKNGLIEGVELPPTNMLATKLSELGKYYSPIRVTWLGPLLVMNLERWNRLPGDIQNIIQKEVQKASRYSFEEGARRNLTDLETMKNKHGIEEVEVDLNDFKKQSEKTYEIFRKEDWYNDEFVRKIRSIK
jgi:TRAP-type transport system periplasmic protein